MNVCWNLNHTTWTNKLSLVIRISVLFIVNWTFTCYGQNQHPQANIRNIGSSFPIWDRHHTCHYRYHPALFITEKSHGAYETFQLQVFWSAAWVQWEAVVVWRGCWSHPLLSQREGIWWFTILVIYINTCIVKQRTSLKDESGDGQEWPISWIWIFANFDLYIHLWYHCSLCRKCNM